MAENIVEKLQLNNVLSEDLQKKLQDMVEKYRDMDEDEKVKFQEEAKHMFKNSLNKVGDNSSSYYNIFSPDQSYVVLVAVLLIILVFVYFGFKLYKSLKDREKKREEKKKNKQLRKRK